MLDWETQTWKWLTHEMCRSYREWLGPYHYLIRQSDVWPALLENDADRRIHDAIEAARKNQPLSPERRGFLALISARLPLDPPPKLDLFNYHEGGIAYPVIEPLEPSGACQADFPDFPGGGYGQALKNIQDNDLKYWLHQQIDSCLSNERRWLPMPNLRPMGMPVMRLVKSSSYNLERVLRRLMLQCEVLDNALNSALNTEVEMQDDTHRSDPSDEINSAYHLYAKKL